MLSTVEHKSCKTAVLKKIAAMQATYKLLYIKQMSYDAFFGTSCNLAQDAQNIFCP